MKTPKLNLLVKVVIAICLGIAAGFVFPDWAARIFITFNGLFSNFLGLIVPLLIIALVAPGIADLGLSAGRMLLVTVVLAYCFSIFSGFFTYFSCQAIFPWLLNSTEQANIGPSGISMLTPYFTVEIPTLINVTTALVVAFILGIGMSSIKSVALKKVMVEFRDIIILVINKVIIPLLPLYIFGIFLSMSISDEVSAVMGVFMKIIVVIFALSFILLVLQFTVAGVIAKRNPFKSLFTMFSAYMTALGTQSSAATIPVTLAQSIKTGVRADVADFVIPLCATIHLSGSTMKIVACSMAIMIMNAMPFDLSLYAGFIMMLGVTMVAAPGVPGGAIMATLGVLSSILGFDQQALGLMIALYIAMDSFGTACNVTGDGAIAMIINRIKK